MRRSQRGVKQVKNCLQLDCLCRRCEPRRRTQFGGVSLGLWNFDLSSDVTSRVEAFERELGQYEQAVGEIVRDSMSILAVLSD